jgi:hypothetical protein
MTTPTDTPTVPCPADQAAPVRRPVSLAELALSQGIDSALVALYLASCAVPSFRIVATVIALQVAA